MAAIELTPDEQTLQQELTELVGQLADNRQTPVKSRADFERMSEKAQQLHQSLKKRNLEPRHHAYMIRNRGVQPETPEFYRHIHPVEDLLKFLQDPHANDDPVDQTLGVTFEFPIFSRRWNHDEPYRLTRTTTGWNIEYKGIGGACDTGGHPYLFLKLKQDSIEYPERLSGWLEWIWHQAHDEGLSRNQVQDALNELAAWVSLIEGRSPSKGVWAGYK